MFSEFKNARRAYTPPVTPIGNRRSMHADNDVRLRGNFNPAEILQNLALPRPFRKRNKTKENSPDHDTNGSLRPRELIELASFGIVELDPAEQGIGHEFQPSHLKNPTWCDCCGDFIWGLCNSSDCLRCLNCQYTIHQRCQHLVTLDCKGAGDTQTTNLCDMIDSKTIKHGNGSSERLSPLFFERLHNDELQWRIDQYNQKHQSSDMILEENGEVLHGFIRVHMNLTRPINVIAGTRPPSIYDILKEEEDGGRKTLTSFYLPHDTVKALHITSEFTAREVINALLKKFKVADNPLKFALYERSYDKVTNHALLRRIEDNEIPLILALMWVDDEKQFVLLENEMDDIPWENFAVAELNNFLKILDLEEEEYLNQVKLKYRLLHEKMREAMEKLKSSPSGRSLAT